MDWSAMAAWVEANVRAWNSNDPARIARQKLAQLDVAGRCREFTEWWMQRKAA